jgi:hypothetical protein
MTLRIMGENLPASRTFFPYSPRPVKIVIISSSDHDILDNERPEDLPQQFPILYAQRFRKLAGKASVLVSSVCSAIWMKPIS